TPHRYVCSGTLLLIHVIRIACGNTQCPFGQDCLQLDGTARCIDPCQHYTPLQDAWRATDFKANPESVACDSLTDWQGWYRLFIGNSSVQMPERCIESHMCGTDAPLWLQTPHPTTAQGIIQGRVCGSWEGGCCQFQSHPIHMKACPGNYQVYKFVSPTLCRLAYCADSNTHNAMFLLHCFFGMLSCGPGLPGGFPEPELVCGQDYLRLAVQKRALQEQGLNASSAHLIDPRCHQQVDHPEAMWYLVERSRGVCGNVVKVSVVQCLSRYQEYQSPNSKLKVKSLLLQFVSDQEHFYKHVIHVLRGGRVGVVRSGDPTRASMTLYQRPDYSQPFPSGPVSLPLGSALHVGVSMENYDNNGFVLVLENCYVTNSPSANDLVQHALIQNRCPVDRRHVAVVENGRSQRARFSALLFLFHGTYNDVYLHCRISLCDRDSGPCSSVSELQPVLDAWSGRGAQTPGQVDRALQGFNTQVRAL
uniref:ZP domain-containing protein n=1 Tax=Seriola dumerili TaxID=41447 RepID=A0A3B4TQU0_SERDU